MIGWAFRQLAIWGGIGLVAYAVVGYRLLQPPTTEPTVIAVPAAGDAHDRRGPGGGGRKPQHLAARAELSDAARKLRDARRRADPELLVAKDRTSRQGPRLPQRRGHRRVS